MQGTPHKTLIIRLSSVGDIVLSTPLIRALHRRFPQSQIDYLVRTEYSELLRGNPYLSTVYTFPAGGTADDLRQIRQNVLDTSYDLIVDIHGSLRSRILCRGMRNVVRINKRVVPRFILVQFRKDFYRLFGGAPGVADRYLETVSQYGVTDDGAGLEVFPGRAEEQRVDELLHDKGMQNGTPLIGLCPSARHFTKMWPEEFFAETAAVLGRKHNVAIALFGSADELVRSQGITRQIRTHFPAVEIIDSTGKLSFLETAALMDRCRLILSNDSGLMHLAAARKRKILAIFGSTVRQFGFLPPPELSIVLEQHELKCRPCTHIGRKECPRGHFRCMREISASRAIDAASALLQV